MFGGLGWSRRDGGGDNDDIGSCHNNNGPSPGHTCSHSRDSSLDEASMSDLTSTSYQNVITGNNQPQTQSNNSSATSELTSSPPSPEREPV